MLNHQPNNNGDASYVTTLLLHPIGGRDGYGLPTYN